MDDLKDKKQNEGFKSRLGRSDEEQIRSLIKNMEGFAEKIKTEGYDEDIQDKLGLNQKSKETIHLLAESIDDMMRNWNLCKFSNPKKRF